MSKTLLKKKKKEIRSVFYETKRRVTKKIFSFLNDGETLEENQRQQSIQNSMLYRECGKRKERNCQKHCRKREEKEIRSVFYEKKDQ